MNRLLVAASVALISHLALAETADEILNRNNRVLAPPPKSLRANASEGASRSQEKRARVSRAAADDTLTVQPVTSYLNQTGGSGSGPSVSPEQRFEYRQNRRGEKLSRYGFSGQRVFGVGFVGAGVYGIFGAEVDFNIGNGWSAGFGIGTGMAYSTWGVQGRYFFNEGRVSTFMQFGYANWNLGRTPDSNDSVSPHHLAERFFYGDSETPKYQSAHLVYPGIGVLYQHPSGLAVSAQIDYLIHMRDFAGGLTAGAGFFYYF